MIFLTFSILNTKYKSTRDLLVNHSVLRHKDLTLLNLKSSIFLCLKTLSRKINCVFVFNLNLKHHR